MGLYLSIYERIDWELTVGGGLNQYDGAHFGEVIWARDAGNSDVKTAIMIMMEIKTMLIYMVNLIIKLVRI